MHLVHRSIVNPASHQQQQQCDVSMATRQQVLPDQRLDDITPGRVNSSSAHRSNVLETIEESKHETNTLDTKANTKPGVKTFVSDWLDKHNGGVSLSDSDVTSRSSPHKSRHNKCDKLNYSGEELLHSGTKYRSKTTKNDPRNSSPKSSPSRSRKDLSLPLGGAGNKPSKRTIAWVEAMSEARTHCDGQEAESDVNDTRAASTNQTEAMSETMQSFNDVIAHLDKEIHHSSNGVKDDSDVIIAGSPPPQYDSLVTKAVTDTSRVSHVNTQDDVITARNDCNDNVKTTELTLQNIINKAMKDLDDSIDSDVPFVPTDKCDVITNLFMSNRESVYELQVDEQLESTSRSSIRNSFHSEDDAWSLGSLHKESDEKMAIRYANLTNKILDNIEIPSLSMMTALEHDVNSYKVSTLDSGNGTQLDNSFATTDHGGSKTTSRVDLDTSTGVSTMESYYRSSQHGSDVIDLEKEYSHINHLCRHYDDAAYDVIDTLASRQSPPPGSSSAVDRNLTSATNARGSIPVRPSNLRRPDGSSNPNLCDASCGSGVYLSSPSEACGGSTSTATTISSKQTVQLLQETSSGTHEVALVPTQQQQSLKIVNSKNSAKKPPTGGIVSKLVKLSASSSPVKIQEVSQMSSAPSKDHSRSSSVKSESSRQSSSQTTTLYTRSHSAPAKPLVPTKVKADSKGVKVASSLSSCSTPTHVPHKPPKTQSKNSFTSRLPLCNGNKRSKDSPSPTKAVSANTSELSKNTKQSKSILRFRNKSPSPKRDKSSKLLTSGGKGIGLNYLSDKGSYSRSADSDSGNDSGIVKYDVRFLSLSPVTKRAHPRMSMHSMSSGNGSDVSSTVSGGGGAAHVTSYVQTRKEIRADQCNSSGYESMLRDSEVTGTSSSNQESTSDSGHSDKGADNNSNSSPKKRSSTKRSKSAPSHSGASTPVNSRHSSPNKKSSSSYSTGAASPKTWIENRKWDKHSLTDPFEIKVYDIEDVERMARRRREELELRALVQRRQKIRDLLSEQQRLKNELERAKKLLMASRESWSFDLHVAEQTDREDQDFIDALEKETQILAKRVEACKSRIMVVTCFDKTITTNVEELDDSR